MATIKALTDEQKRAHKALLEALGGPTAVAKLVKARLDVALRSNAVSNWMVRGIPADYRPCLAVAAGEQNITVPKLFLDHGKLPAPKEPEVPFLD